MWESTIPAGKRTERGRLPDENSGSHSVDST